MLRALFKLILLVVIVVAVGGFLLGWWSGRDVLPGNVVGTASKIDTERAKQIGAQVGERTAAAATKVAEETKEALGDGALTAKIKAKMALDDTVKALNLNVDTSNGTVTVSGKVRSAGERERALQLARETNGVRQVVDRITLEGK